MHKRFFVLESRNHLATIMTYMDFIHCNNQGAFPKPNKQNAYAFLKLIVEEYIADMSMLPCHTNFQAERCRVLFGLPTPNPRALALMRQVMAEPTIDNVVFEIHNQLKKQIEPRTWTRWTVVAMNGILGVAEGKDHRVAEWEQATGWRDDDGSQYMSFIFSNPVEYILQALHGTFGDHVMVPVNLRGGHVEWRRFNLNEEFAIALCADVLGQLYPQLDFSVITPTVPVSVVEQLRLHDRGLGGFEQFRTDVVCKILHMFGLTYLSSHIQRDRRYDADFTSMGMLTIRESQNRQDQSMQELVASYHRQDRLTAEETELVERWLMDNSY